MVVIFVATQIKSIGKNVCKFFRVMFSANPTLSKTNLIAFFIVVPESTPYFDINKDISNTGQFFDNLYYQTHTFFLNHQIMSDYFSELKPMLDKLALALIKDFTFNLSNIGFNSEK